MGQVRRIWDDEFYGIECMDSGEEWGFEGVYNNNLNHPDPRSGHQIWLKKIEAEKLMRIFYNKFAEQARKKGYDFCYTFEEFFNEKSPSETEGDGKEGSQDGNGLG